MNNKIIILNVHPNTPRRICAIKRRNVSFSWLLSVITFTAVKPARYPEKRRKSWDGENQNILSNMSPLASGWPRRDAHAHLIVLTENAVGFENGGQCVPPDGETYTLYVSKAAAYGLPIRSRRKTLFPRAPTRRCTSRIPKLLCEWKTWSFSWLCDWRAATAHGPQHRRAWERGRPKTV